MKMGCGVLLHEEGLTGRAHWVPRGSLTPKGQDGERERTGFKVKRVRVRPAPPGVPEVGQQGVGGQVTHRNAGQEMMTTSWPPITIVFPRK